MGRLDFKKMQGRQKIKKYTIISLLIVTFILRIDFADAKNVKWKPGNENYRRFPIDRTLQNDGRIPTGQRIQNDRVIQLEQKIQNNRRISNDRILQNGKRIPTGKTIQNDRRQQIDGNMQSDKIIYNDRILQNDKRIPIGKLIENDRSLQIDMQNDRIIPIDRTFQNDRRIPIDRTLQSDRRIPIDRTLQNDRRILNGQHDSMLNDRKKKKNDSDELEMKYNRRVHGASLTDGIMEEDGRKRINKILNNDRLTKNELQKKIDSLTQNINIQQDGRRMLNVTMQNDRQTQNDLEVQNARRFLDERNQEMINARRTGYEKRMWAGTPQRIARQRASAANLQRNVRPRDWAANLQRNVRPRDWAATPQRIARQRDLAANLQRNVRPRDWAANLQRNVRRWNPPSKIKKHKTGKSKFNESEFRLPNYTMPKKLGPEQDAFIPGEQHQNLIKALEEVHFTFPYNHSWMISAACHIISSTQISAKLDIRKFLTVRYFYQENLEYEIGYLVNEIVLKYQRMLELYDLATHYYYNNRARFYAPSTYVLYLYTNVLEMGTVISHLCNMLTEIEDRYRYHPSVNKSGFLDYHLPKGQKVYIVNNKVSAQVAAYEKALAKLKRGHQKQIRKDRKKNLKLKKPIVTTVDRRPKFQNFPLVYGWSIEDIW